jgi:hypothetical protein
MYASETWTPSKTDERLLSVFGRRILRCIFGAWWSRRMVCGGKDTTMNYMSCLMNLTFSNILK